MSAYMLLGTNPMVQLSLVGFSPLDVSFQEFWQYMYLLTAISNLSLLVSIALFCFTFSTNDLCINWLMTPEIQVFFTYKKRFYSTAKERTPCDKGCLGKDERRLGKGDFIIMLSTIIHLLCNIHNNIESLQKYVFKVTLAI